MGLFSKFGKKTSFEKIDSPDKARIESYKCIPEYKGNSVVPSKITMIAGKDGAEVFKETIEIW